MRRPGFVCWGCQAGKPEQQLQPLSLPTPPSRLTPPRNSARDTHTHTLPQGHNCTDYARWFRSNQPYDVEYHDGYEPWFIIDRFRNPWYDVSFRGYGWNKVSHVLNIYYKK